MQCNGSHFPNNCSTQNLKKRKHSDLCQDHSNKQNGMGIHHSVYRPKLKSHRQVNCFPEKREGGREKLIQCNLPKGSKRYHPPKESSNPRNTNRSVRVKEFPRENLTVSNGRLFCNACREEIGLKKMIILNHIKSTKQASGKICIKKKEARKRDIVESLVAYDNKVHAKDRGLVMTQTVHRVKVVS